MSVVDASTAGRQVILRRISSCETGMSNNLYGKDALNFRIYSAKCEGSQMLESQIKGPIEAQIRFSRETLCSWLKEQKSKKVIERGKFYVPVRVRTWRVDDIFAVESYSSDILNTSSISDRVVGQSFRKSCPDLFQYYMFGGADVKCADRRSNNLEFHWMGIREVGTGGATCLFKVEGIVSGNVLYHISSPWGRRS